MVSSLRRDRYTAPCSRLTNTYLRGYTSINSQRVIDQMPNAHDVLFRTLADPTRRAIFERLCREGEQTVGALTARAGVSQPAVSKHLGVLKQAGLVRDRHEGRQTHYSAQLGALGPLIDWTQPDGRLLAKPVRRSRRPAEKDGPMNEACDRNALRRCRTGVPLSAGKALARAHATAPDRGVADEERLQACRGPQFQSSRRLGRRAGLRGPGRRAEQERCPTPGISRTTMRPSI